MQNDDKLSLDLVWQADGHLTETALSALGDGEDALLPESALSHAAGCLRCSAGLGHAALLSLRTGEALRDLPSSAAPAPAIRPAAQPAPLPLPAVLAALALSALGAAPSLVSGVGRVPETFSGLHHSCTVVVRTGCAVAESGALAGWLTALTWGSAALLVMMGLGVARAMGKRLSLKGEV
jgi:hypothetical protein